MEGEERVPTPIGVRGAHWHLAVRQGTAGPEYTVFVDGALVTQGHATGESALAEAQQLLGEAAPADHGGQLGPDRRGGAVQPSDRLAAAGE